MKLKEIRALIDAATPGPWENREDDDEPPKGRTVFADGGNWAALCVSRELDNEANARFIAAARTLMPLLLDVAETAQRCYPTLHSHMIHCKLHESGDCSCRKHDADVALGRALAALESAK